MPTRDELRAAAREYRDAQRRADELRAARDTLAADALEAGWTQARVAEALELGHQRVGQIARERGGRRYVKRDDAPADA